MHSWLEAVDKLAAKANVREIDADAETEPQERREKSQQEREK